MKQLGESRKKWANRHEAGCLCSFVLIVILIVGIIGGVIGANFYQPVETTKIELLKSIANDVWENTQESVQKYSNVFIELSFEELSEMIETDLSLFEDLTASVEKRTVKISEKEVTVEVDFSKDVTNVQERHSKQGCSFWGSVIGVLGIIIVAWIIGKMVLGIIALMRMWDNLRIRFPNKKK